MSHIFICLFLFPPFTQSKERPPRLKRFKLKELWRRLFSVKGHEHVLPSRTNTHGSRRSDTLDLQRERRFRTSSYHRRQSSDGASKGEEHGRYMWIGQEGGGGMRKPCKSLPCPPPPPSSFYEGAAQSCVWLPPTRLCWHLPLPP